MAEEMKETMEQYENELEASFRKMDEGDIVEGDVLSVSDEEAVIDLKYYAQGILKASEYSDDPNVTLTEALNEGDRVKAKVISVDDGEGNIMLSKREANQVLAWDRLQKLMEEETVLSLTVGGVVNGGVIVYVEGIRGFIPASQLSLNYVEDLNTWLKKEVEAKIITVDESRNKLVLSAKEVEKAKAQEELNHKMAMMRPGMVIKAILPTIFPFSVICNLIIHYDGISFYSNILGPIICKPLKLSNCSSFPIVASLLCGYPLGCKYCCDLYELGCISKEEYLRLLNIASNASPIFLIGSVGAAMLGNIKYGFILLLGNYLAPLIIGFFTKKILMNLIILMSIL